MSGSRELGIVLAAWFLTLGLWWLLERIGMRDWFDGFRIGLVSGLVLWGAFALGLYSISTAPGPLLTGWWVGQAPAMTVAN